MMKKDFEIITLHKDFSLAKLVAQHVDKQLFIPQVIQFADGEFNVYIPNDVSFERKDIIVIHSTSEPVNDNIMQLLFLIGKLKMVGVHKVHAIIPYFGYSRQSEGENGQRRGNANIVAKIIETAGADSVAVVEAHEKILASFFDVPFCDIDVDGIIVEHIKKRFTDLEDICLVAPDKGAQERVITIAENLDVPTVLFSKKRCGIDEIEIIEMSGACDQKKSIIIDDIISTAGTAIKTAEVLLGNGSSQVYGYFVHPVFAKQAVKLIAQSPFEKIYVSNSIQLSQDQQIEKIEVFDISNALVDYIKSLML